jgi:MMP alpha-(1->4)-mannosyltransferase
MPDNDAPLKICLLSYRSNPHCGGQGVYVQNLSTALVKQGHHVDILSGPPDLFMEEPNIRIIRLPCLDLYNPDDLFRVPTVMELCNPVNLIEWLGVSTMGFPEPFTFGIRAYRFLKSRKNRYDIVHDNQSLSYGVWALSRLLPTVATIHHPITVDRDVAISSSAGFREKIKQLRWHSFIRMQKIVARTFSRIITVSKQAKQDIRRDFKIPGHKFSVVPNGINTALFHPLPGVKREKNRIIVTNSADTPLKGLYYLLQAVARLSASRTPRLVVVGTPNKNGRVSKLIRELGIGGLVTFTGRIDHREFVRQYAKAAIAVVPSVYEGFGLPAGEAMACRVPVICTTGGALPEVVGDAGMLVPPADHEALARAIGDLLDNPALARRLGNDGFRRVHDHFTWEAAAAKTASVYREVIRDYGRFSTA